MRSRAFADARLGDQVSAKSKLSSDSYLLALEMSCILSLGKARFWRCPGALISGLEAARTYIQAYFYHSEKSKDTGLMSRR